MESDDLAQV